MITSLEIRAILSAVTPPVLRSMTVHRDPSPIRQHSATRRTRKDTITEHNLFYYLSASFTNEQLPLLKVAALYVDKLHFLNAIGKDCGDWRGSHLRDCRVDRMKQKHCSVAQQTIMRADGSRRKNLEKNAI